MNSKRIICLLLSFVVFASCLTGCGEDETQVYNGDAEILSLASGVIAANDKLEFYWDNDLKCVLLKNNETGKIWSNIPYEAYLNKEVYSTLSIIVQDMQSYQREQISSEELQNSGRISCEKIENGIRMTYYYDSVKISVPVEFTLREDSLRMAVDASKIVEGDENYRIYNAFPSSKFCSVRQDETDAYIFVPYGTGALISTTELPDGKRKLDNAGRNVAALSTRNPVDPYEDSRFQVFGIKDKQDALMCIAEDCAGAVGINILAGDRTTDYSSINPIFFFIDYDDVKGRAANSGDIRQLSERTQSVISVGFYPLSGESADYNGMAKRYRKYLIDSGFVKENADKANFESPYALTFLGGVQTTSSVAGVPVTTLNAMTTYSAAESIVSEMIDATGKKPVVRLQGYGETGINIGEVAGGFGFASKFGKDSERQALEKYCGDNGIPLFTQFELIRYSKSGSGYSYSFDAAKTATLHVAEQTGVNVPLRDYNADDVCRLLARSKISSAVDKLISFANKESVSGISLSSLGTISYSDYSDGSKYATTSGMDSDTAAYIKRIKNSGRKVAGSASTYFAAGLMDAVFEAPNETSGMHQLTRDIPFYQMVFSGITPLYSSSVNLDSNPERKVMLSAVSGMGLGFSLVDNFEKAYMENNVYELYACVYGKNKDYITDVIKRYSDVYSAVAGCEIDRYDVIDENVSKTTFKNGTVIYANHSSGEVQSPVGALEGYGFKLGSEG